MTVKNLLVAIFCFMVPALSHAGFVFTPGVTYLTRNINDTGSNIESNLSSVDLRLGYQFDFNLYLGGMYSLSGEKFQVGTASSEYNDYILGASVGYSRWNFFGILTYAILGERDHALGGRKHTGAKGFQFDVGYVVPITESFSVGPQLTWRKIDFDNLETNGVQTSGNYDWDGITPYIALWLHFK